MKIFIDSADLKEIEMSIGWGMCDGVTTNPSLIKSAAGKMGNIEMKDYIEEICKVAGRNRPVSLEVISTSPESMEQEARILHKKFNKYGNVVIKIPISTDINSPYGGIRAISSLKANKVPVNVTLIMTPEQALLAAKAGADYVSPFAGRIDDHIRNRAGIKFSKTDYFPAEGVGSDDNGIRSGIDLVKKILAIYRNYGIQTEVIAASIRNAKQAREAAEAGAHIATLPFNVIEEMIKHPKTFEGIKKFSDDVVPEYKALFES